MMILRLEICKAVGQNFPFWFYFFISSLKIKQWRVYSHSGSHEVKGIVGRGVAVRVHAHYMYRPIPITTDTVTDSGSVNTGI